MFLLNSTGRLKIISVSAFKHCKLYFLQAHAKYFKLNINIFFFFVKLQEIIFSQMQKAEKLSQIIII